MATVIHGPRFNRRVTCDSDPENARSESDLAVNPLNPYNMVGSSKRFTDIAGYAFSLAAYATFDCRANLDRDDPFLNRYQWDDLSQHY